MPTVRTTILTLLSAVAAVTCGAQTTCAVNNTCSISLNASLTKTYVARLDLSAATSTLTVPTAAQFGSTAGVNTANAVQLTVRSNAPYTITAQAAATNFTGNGGSKPASSLRYSTDGFTTLKQVTGSGSALVSNAAATNTTTFTIGYNTTYDWLQDRPGTYTLVINYTLTSP